MILTSQAHIVRYILFLLSLLIIYNKSYILNQIIIAPFIYNLLFLKPNFI